MSRSVEYRSPQEACQPGRHTDRRKTLEGTDGFLATSRRRAPSKNKRNLRTWFFKRRLWPIFTELSTVVPPWVCPLRAPVPIVLLRLPIQRRLEATRQVSTHAPPQRKNASLKQLRSVYHKRCSSRGARSEKSLLFRCVAQPRFEHAYLVAHRFPINAAGPRAITSSTQPTTSFLLVRGLHGRLCVAHVLDLALGVPRHLLVEEERHAAAVALAVDARYERLPAAGRARERRRGHLVRGRHGVRHGHRTHTVASRARELSRGSAVGASREFLHLVDLELIVFVCAGADGCGNSVGS